MVVLRSMTLVITPPIVSSPSDSGVTSRSSTSLTSPLMIAAWTAAPMATTSSGLTVMFGSLPPVRRRTRCLHRRDPRRPAHEDDLVDVVGGDLGVLHGLLDRAQAALDEVGGELLERRPHQVDVEVLGPGGVGGDEGQVDGGLGDRRKLHLGLLGSLEQALQRLGVVAQVDAVGLLELVGQVVDDAAVEVVAAEVGVPGRGPDLDHALSDGQDADVERAAAEVEDQHGLVLELVHPVGKGRGRRLVDDPENLEPGDLAGVLGGLSLRVVEVRRDGDHRLGDPFAEELAGVVDQLPKHLRRDLLRRVAACR